MGQTLAAAPPISPDNTLGDRIRRARVARRMLQTELARLIDKPQSSISGYENGSVGIDAETVKRIAEVLGTSVAALFGEAPDTRVGLMTGAPAPVTLLNGIDISDLDEDDQQELIAVLTQLVALRRWRKQRNRQTQTT